MTTLKPSAQSQTSGHSHSKVPLKSTVVTLGPEHQLPWWWSEIDHSALPCALSYIRLVHKGKISQQTSSGELPLIFIKTLRFLLSERSKGTDYIFTFECDLVGWAIAFWQTILPIRLPKHVILQFIMRELQPTFASRAKYALMRFLLSSVHRVICSSKKECEYYKRVFDWKMEKLVFVPFHTSNAMLDYSSEEPDDYIIAAGRSFRDYDTLVSAITDTGIKTVIVGGAGSKQKHDRYPNLTVLENIPQHDLAKLLARASVVVLPLENREISIGQTVLLQAMAMGKPVVATRTAGTEDYIQQGSTGLLVEPGQPQQLREAIQTLMSDENLRKRLGSTAREVIKNRHLPAHYALNIARSMSF